MFQLNRRVEYVFQPLSLICCRRQMAAPQLFLPLLKPRQGAWLTQANEVAVQPNEEPTLHSARSIAEATNIPFDMVTKCLQRLKTASAKQVKASKGYRLAVAAEELSVGHLLAAVFFSCYPGWLRSR